MNITENILSDNLFTHFVDKWDMTMCCSSDITGKALNAAAYEYGLYFPLIHDEKRSVREHVEAMEYTSRSARFGAFIDNVVGMNWIIPSGKKVRVGERVVKSTTGYDLFKFLLMADGHFGYPSDYVIRLRPFSDTSYRGKFAGDRKSLNGVYQELRASSWSHWIDEVDLIISENGAPCIEVTINCQLSEKASFFDFFQGVASRNRSHFEETAGDTVKALPWLTIKCLPSEAFKIAEDLVKHAGGVCSVLLINGVILINPRDQIRAKQMIYDMRPNLEHQGGHVYGNGLDKRQNDIENTEETWVTNLLRTWESL